MSQANHRCEVESLLEEWAENPAQGGNVISCLVEFLFDDPHWLNENIKRKDRETLLAASRILSTQE